MASAKPTDWPSVEYLCHP